MADPEPIRPEGFLSLYRYIVALFLIFMLVVPCTYLGSKFSAGSFLFGSRIEFLHTSSCQILLSCAVRPNWSDRAVKSPEYCAFQILVNMQKIYPF